MRVEHQVHQPVGDKVTPYDLVQAQLRMREWVSGLYDQAPWTNGTILENVALSAYVANDIEHKLGRELRGWELVRDQASLASFRASLSSSQAINNATWTQVNFDAESFDIGSVYDNASGYDFVAPHDGLYQLSFNLLLSIIPDGTSFLSLFRKNGSAWLYGSMETVGAANTPTASTAFACEQLSSGDSIEVWAYHTSGGAETLSGHATVIYSWFSGRAINELADGQNELSVTEKRQFLRLYSTMDKTVSLKVW